MTRVERRAILPLGTSLVLDQQLAVAPVTEAIEVRAVMPAAVTSHGTVNLPLGEIQRLPVGRTPFLLAELTPGLTDNTPNQNQVTIGGGFAYDNVFLVDGVDVNDNVFGQPNGLFIEEGIQEVQVLASSASRRVRPLRRRRRQRDHAQRRQPVLGRVPHQPDQRGVERGDAVREVAGDDARRASCRRPTRPPRADRS